MKATRFVVPTRCNAHGEWVVRAYYADGKRCAEADGYQDSKEDAHATARAEADGPFGYTVSADGRTYTRNDKPADFTNGIGPAVRAAIAELTSGKGDASYFDSVEDAWNAVDSVLRGCDLFMDCGDLSGREGRTVYEVRSVHDEYAGPVGRVAFSWYTLPSGRVELTAYVT